MQPEFVKKYSGVTCTVELAFLFSKYQLDSNTRIEMAAADVRLSTPSFL